MKHCRLFIFICVLASSCQNNFRQGEALYLEQCASCHMDDGSGLASLIPPLTDTKYLHLNADGLPCTIRFGKEGPISIHGKTYDQPMPGNKALNEVEIANILNYIQQRWGDKTIFYSRDRVIELLNQCKPKH